MVRHTRKANGAEENPVIVLELVESSFRHHAPGLGVGLTAPWERVPFETDIETFPGRLQHPNTFRNNFPADSVSWNNSNLITLHR